MRPEIKHSPLNEDLGTEHCRQQRELRVGGGGEGLSRDIAGLGVPTEAGAKSRKRQWGPDHWGSCGQRWDLDVSHQEPWNGFK